jgi:hypothetical protein
MQKLSVKLQNTIVIAVAIAILGLGVAVVLIFSPRNAFSGPVGENATSAQYNPQQVDGGFALPLVSLEGDWYIKDDSLAFTAKVQGESIKIEMGSGDGYSTTYWHGTFKTAESPNSTITSTKTEADDEIVLVQDAAKDFQIGTDGITFKFSALGFSKIVTLKR